MIQIASGREVSRRGFLAGALATGAGVAASGLSGCAPKQPGTEDQPTEIVYKEPSFFTSPDPISDDEIVETVSADIVIVGAGDSGLMAALAASETGAKVVLLEQNDKFMAHGLAHACLGTKVHEREGIALDKHAIIRHLCAQSNNRANLDLLRLWADESGAIYDRLIDLAEENGLMVVPLGGGNPEDPLYPEFDCALMFRGDAPLDTEEDEGQVAQTWLFSLLENEIRLNGCDIRYNTTAEQLAKNGWGRVNVVLAKDENGNYIEFHASKAVVLATGDYGNDEEMVKHYCPWQTKADVNFYQPPVNKGAGHKMGLWMGAAMQPAPHCPALHPEHAVDPGEPPLAASPVLRVNALGERYENEEVPAPLVCEGRIRQPKNKAWAVVDSHWRESAPSLTPGLLRTPQITDEAAAAFESQALCAETIEELAELMEVPAEAFKSTVARYTELAKNGFDEDFGKSPNNLWPVEDAPFYAIEVPVGTMNTLGGLLVNSKMQVLSADNEAKTISGLYAAGNASGGFFGSTYPSAVSGINKGWCIVSGYLAGKNAAQETSESGEQQEG